MICIKYIVTTVLTELFDLKSTFPFYLPAHPAGLRLECGFYFYEGQTIAKS